MIFGQRRPNLGVAQEHSADVAGEASASGHVAPRGFFELDEAERAMTKSAPQVKF
jgi:hypothetical protein